MLTFEVTRAPNFQKFLQTSEEFCNKNIPVVFTTSANNRDLQGDFDFFAYDFATYKIEFLTFPEFHVPNSDFFDFPG